MSCSWIEINLPFGPIYRTGDFEEEDSFSKRELNKPGTLIETEENKVYLIGHVNAAGGVCDDCLAFEEETIIKRYAIIWDKEKENEKV